MEANCARCSLLSRSPHVFSHVGAPCGWPDLAGKCPDCGREGDTCTFFSENEEENGCCGFSRTVVLCLRCQLDGAKQRRAAQLRQRVIILSGGEGSPHAVAFATGHVNTYKDQLKQSDDGIWLPQLVASPDTEFYWNRTTVPWRFLQSAEAGAEAVTMRGLLTRLGMGGEDEPVIESQAVPNVAALAVQVQELKQLVEMFVGKSAMQSGGGANNNNAPPAGDTTAVAARLAETLAQMQGNKAPASAAPAATSWNPSQTFNLSANTNATVVNNQSTDLEMMRLLAQSGASADQIMRFMQTRAPAAAPMEHRTAWLQVMEGTSPLCTYTGMQGETRQVVTPKTFTVQTYDGSGKLTLKITAWPPAKPEAVAIFRLRELGNDWKRGLVQANTRLIQITPVTDRGLTPVIPVNVDAFLDHCYSCLQGYDAPSVLRAWEAAHHFMVDEYIAKRSQPSWDAIWMMPVFQIQLKGVAGATPRAAEGTFDANKYCVSWNLKQGRRCVKSPEATCTKVHLCLRCGGDHRMSDCTRE
jgi:hypothetical protein